MADNRARNLGRQQFAITLRSKPQRRYRQHFIFCAIGNCCPPVFA